MIDKLFTRRSWVVGSALSGAAAWVGLSACDGESTAAVDEQKVLADIAEIVAKPLHAALDAAARDFEEVALALAEAPTDGALQAAQGSWRVVQLAWYRARVFGFGPSKAVEGNIRWAKGCEGEKVEATIASGAPFDPPKLGTSQKGLPALEYLLFDLTGNAAVVEALTADENRRAFLSALSTYLKDEVAALAEGWTNHAGELATAGAGSSIYKAPKDAMDALFNQLIYAADVAIQQIGEPLGVNADAPQPELEEARLSDNTLMDSLALLDGLVAVYRGDLGETEGLGITDLVNERSASLDGEVTQALAAARKAVEDIPPPLRTALEGDSPVLLAAVEALRGVKRVLTSDVATALGVTISFSDMDGD